MLSLFEILKYKIKMILLIAMGKHLRLLLNADSGFRGPWYHVGRSRSIVTPSISSQPILVAGGNKYRLGSDRWQNSSSFLAERSLASLFRIQYGRVTMGGIFAFIELFAFDFNLCLRVGMFELLQKLLILTMKTL